MMNHSAAEPTPFRPVWRRSGTWMVIMLFVYAGLMVGTMYLYWELYTRPFRPLQEAINARHPHSMPRVIGGKHKSHREGSKPTLRIVVTVDFDPVPVVEGSAREAAPPAEPVAKPSPPTPEGAAPAEDRIVLTDEMVVDPRVHEWFQSLVTLAQQNHGLDSYEVLEIFLEYRRPEKTNRTLSSTRPKEAWLEAYPGTQPPPTTAVPR